jgi:hypothetical protein
VLAALGPAVVARRRAVHVEVHVDLGAVGPVGTVHGPQRAVVEAGGEEVDLVVCKCGRWGRRQCWVCRFWGQRRDLAVRVGGHAVGVDVGQEDGRGGGRRERNLVRDIGHDELGAVEAHTGSDHARALSDRGVDCV